MLLRNWNRRRYRPLKLLLPIAPSTFQRPSNRIHHRFANRIRIAKPDFAFGRMHIHVDRGRVDRQEQRNRRKAVAEHEVRIGRPYCAKQHLVAHRAAVDEVELAQRVGARISRQPGEPGDHHAVSRRLQ